jgi:hypothetical protein
MHDAADQVMNLIFGRWRSQTLAAGGRPFHSPHYDFNDEALPIGASLFARLVEKKLPRLSTI